MCWNSFSCVSFCSCVWLLQRLLGQWVTWWHMINWKNSFPNSFPLYWASTRRIQNTTSSARYSPPHRFPITANVWWKLMGLPVIQSKCTCFPALWTVFIMCSIKTWKCVIVFALFKTAYCDFHNQIRFYDQSMRKSRTNLCLFVCLELVSGPGGFCEYGQQSAGDTDWWSLSSSAPAGQCFFHSLLMCTTFSYS